MPKNSNEQLLKLQEQIAKCYEIEKKILVIPNLINEKKEILERSKWERTQLISQNRKLKNYMETSQNVLDEIKQNRIISETRIEKITTQRDYDAEEEKLEKYRIEERRIREKRGKVEKKLELNANAIKEKEESIKILSQSFEEEIKQLEESKVDLDKEFKVAKEKKDKLSQGVSPDLLFKFERIIKNKGGVAKVELVSGVCQGCHMELPQQFVNKVRLNEEIQFCPYCSRILEYKEGAEDLEILESDSKYYSVRSDTENDDTDEMNEIMSEADSTDVFSDDDKDSNDRADIIIADESEFDL